MSKCIMNLNHSLREAFLIFRKDVYNQTDLVFSNMAELLLVSLGIRKGAIITIKDVSQIPRLLELFPMLYGKQYASNGNFIICHKDDVEQCEKIDRIRSKFVINRKEPSEELVTLDILTGEILDYFTPMSLGNPREPESYSCHIRITLNTGKKVIVFPQAINGQITQEIKQKLEAMVEQIKDINSSLLPPNFQIVDAEYVTTLLPSQSPPAGGKTKRKTKRKSRRKRSIKK